MTAARDDDFMALPGTKADSTTPPFEPIFPIIRSHSSTL